MLYAGLRGSVYQRSVVLFLTLLVLGVTPVAPAVTAEAAPKRLSVATDSLPRAYTGYPYDADLTAKGGTPPYAWSIVAGSPAGLSLAPDGIISGEPVSAGKVRFRVGVRDANGSQAFQWLRMSVEVRSVEVATLSLPDGAQGSAYSAQLEASGGTPPYGWSITTGALPDGLALASDGTITGTPTATRTANLSVRVVDSAGESGTQASSILVQPPTLTVATSSLPDAAQGSAYSAQLEASGGNSPYGWSITAGALPDGLALASDGTITGTPTATGTANLSVRVVDSAGESGTKALNILVQPPTLAVATSSLPVTAQGSAYSAQLEASGGTPPYGWSITGSTAGRVSAGFGRNHHRHADGRRKQQCPGYRH